MYTDKIKVANNKQITATSSHCEHGLVVTFEQLIIVAF